MQGLGLVQDTVVSGLCESFVRYRVCQDAASGYRPGLRPLQAQGYAIATSTPLATQAGCAVLRAGGTDTAAVQRTRSGVLAGCISIPSRYVHTPAEVVDRTDVEQAVELLRVMAASKELPGA